LGDGNDNEGPILNRVAVGISHVVLQQLIPVYFDFLRYLFAADANIFLECRRSYPGGWVLLLGLSLLESSSWDVEAFLYRWTSDPFDEIGIIWDIELVTTE
jgi:hypothetical protein